LGDGSDFDVQSLDLTHLYTSSGTYTGRAALLENDAVHWVDFTANVSIAGGRPLRSPSTSPTSPSRTRPTWDQHRRHSCLCPRTGSTTGRKLE